MIKRGLIMESFENEFEKIISEYAKSPPENIWKEKLSQSSSPIIIFGAGLGGHAVLNVLHSYVNCEVLFCDNYKSGVDEKYQIPIISPAQLEKDYRNCFVIIGVGDSYYTKIYNQLKAISFPLQQIVPRTYFDEKISLDEMQKYYSGYQWAFDFFEDEMSKKIILDRIRAYLLYSEIEHLPDYTRYFEPSIIKLTNDEVFVDGGGYTGDTSLDFIRNADNKYRHIYCFEPDLDNYNMAVANLRQYKGVTVINQGLWSKPDNLSFSAGHSTMSQLDSVGNTIVPVTSLDSYFDKNQNLPTLIKLDIQGAEKEALTGSQKIIREGCPKLVICVYHKIEDIYQIPRLIAEYAQYNTYSLRHYSYNTHETVLYVL